MNRKIISFAIAFLLCVGLCSAGFAAWVITSDGTENATGTITVDTVSDASLTISPVTISEKICFGWSDSGSENPWLLNDDPDFAEKLSVTFDVNITSSQDLPKGYKIDLSGVVTASDSEKYNKLVSANIIGALPTISNVTVNGSGTSFSATITLNFTWGSHFDAGHDNIVNPLKYYNALSKTAPAGKYVQDLNKLPTYVAGEGKTYADDAKVALDALHTLLENVTYNVELTAKLVKA